MKKSLLIGIGIVLIIGFIIYRTFAGTYNNLVDREERVKGTWAEVENAYQSRMDKTKNLVQIIKGSAEFERGTLKDVIEARSKATSVQVDAGDLSPEKIQQFQQAQDQFGSALSRLMVVVEKYPELKTTDAFQKFQDQYEGMDNRILVARKRFNDEVQTYNTYLRTFPRNFIAGMYGFQSKGYFQAQQGAETAPEIDFSK